MRKTENLRGIGVWCILFILISLLQTPYAAVLVFAAGIVVLHLSTLILMFKKKKITPMLIIITLWVAVAFSAININSYLGNLVILVGASVWTWYLKVSKRVKNTFVK